MSEDILDDKEVVSNEATATESSTDAIEEVELTPEEIQTLKEENQRLKQHLRNQSKKKEKVDTESEEEVSTDGGVVESSEIAELREELQTIKKMVTVDPNQFQEKAVDWMFDNYPEYAPENDLEGSKYAQLNRAVKQVNEMFPIKNEEDYQLNLLRAHNMLNVKSEKTPTQIQREGSQAVYEKQSASGVSGSTVRSNAEGNSVRLTSAEKAFLERRGLSAKDVAENMKRRGAV